MNAHPGRKADLLEVLDYTCARNGQPAQSSLQAHSLASSYARNYRMRRK